MKMADQRVFDAINAGMEATTPETLGRKTDAQRASHLVAPVLVKAAEPVNVPMTAEDALVGGLQIRSLAMAFCNNASDRELLLRVGAQLVAAGRHGAIGVGT